MPEHVHLLVTPADNVTLEHAVQLIKGGYSHALEPSSVENEKSGNQDLPITEFAINRISLTIATTFIKIQSNDNS